MEKAGRTLRYAAAEARRLLVERAAARLGVPASALVTEAGGVLHRRRQGARRSHIATCSPMAFSTQPCKWNGKTGNDLFSRGAAEPKSPAAYTVVGHTVPRTDIADNAFGRLRYVTRHPCARHAACPGDPARRSSARSRPRSTKPPSPATPGARVVHERGLLAVVAGGNGTPSVRPRR